MNQKACLYTDKVTIHALTVSRQVFQFTLLQCVAKGMWTHGHYIHISLLCHSKTAAFAPIQPEVPTFELNIHRSQSTFFGCMV